MTNQPNLNLLNEMAQDIFREPRITSSNTEKAFETFMKAVKFDFMFMGEKDGVYYFKHAETRYTVQIPKQ